MLITDDDTASRNTVAALLSPAGHIIRFAANGEEALAAAEQEPPDLVLLDVMMPGLDGFEVCRRLRTRLGADYVPIILITALDGRSDVVRGLEAGADDFLHKPVHGAELRARVSNLLKVRDYHRLVASERDRALAMVDELRQQVLRADRLATLGTFAAGVSHELNNIAQVMRGALEAPANTTEEILNVRDILMHVGGHITELARTILNISRPKDQGVLEIDLSRTLDEVRNMLRLTGRTRHAIVDLVMPEQACLIRANKVHAQQVFLNLLSNAADAVADRREPRIEIGVRANPGGRVEAWVQDNGPGMPEEVLNRIFEPFFTTKPTGSGSGLGLPVVKQLVESWGGTIQVQSKPGSGTRMVIDIPSATPPAPGTPS
ncbi:sensor histidine kinase [Hyalangium gracile]|uniref:sensor histidine kinase n=1 Tax=Hyalangium gracile TaxID=394092 RepID=UPI001CCCD43B|nr:hybrid sensor histidine kinase/response regulator [Hyalangium gracile]